MFNIGSYDSLPIYVISNKENSFFQGRPSKQPSFLKHIGGENNLDIEFVGLIFRGLTQSFP